MAQAPAKITIPDNASLEELTAFVDKHNKELKKMENNGTPLKPAQASQAEAILEACKKILSDPTISDELRLWTLPRQAYSLTLLAYAEPKLYFGKLIAAADEYEEKGYAKNAKLLERDVLRIGTKVLTEPVDPNDPKPLKLDFNVFLERILAYVQANPGSASQLIVQDFFASMEKMSPDAKRTKMQLAAAKMFSKHYLASNDSFDVVYGRDLQGLERFLSQPGKPMPIGGILLNGKPFDPETLEDKVVLVQFWEPKCVHCVKAIPFYAELFEKYGKKGFTIVGVCTAGSQKSIQKFVADMELPNDKRISWPIILDELTPKKDRMAEYYAFKTTPWVFLVGRDGNVICTNPSQNSLPMLIEQALFTTTEQDAEEKPEKP